MYRALRDFVDQICDAVGPTCFERALTGALEALGLPSFAYLSLPMYPKKPPVLISSYPSAWTEHYLRQRYEMVDPVIVSARKSSLPFRWSRDVVAESFSDAQRKLFEEAATFGIRHGMTIPLHDRRGHIAALTFATDEKTPIFEGQIGRHCEILYLMALMFDAQMRGRSMSERMVDGTELSPRELECLGWAAQGRSAWHIGRMLGVSQRTAAFHLQNAKDKLGVRSICQAVAKLAASRSRP